MDEILLRQRTLADQNDVVFLQACRCEPTPYTPVWLMRQAGRYMKEYRTIRDKTPFLEICKNKDLVTEITVTAQETIGADAAIIFADILLLVDAWGMGLHYEKGDGPVIDRPIRGIQDVERLPKLSVKDSFGFLSQAIQRTRKELKKNVPLIGFSGAPFTLASYMIEGGASKNFSKTKTFMKKEPLAWEKLMGKIVRQTTDYLKLQIASGADAIQVFDTWVGCLSRGEYEKNVLPFSKALITEIAAHAPVIHFGTGTGAFLDLFSQAGSQVIGVDHRVKLDRAWKIIGEDKAIQGNLDPTVLLGTTKEIQTEVKKILRAAGGRPGHIFNLGHGILPNTPVENVIALIDMVHELSQKRI